MADEAERFTPRKLKLDSGLTNQTELRDEIADAMRDEILECSVEQFLLRLAPFSPDDQWIASARQCLKEKGLLKTPAERALRDVDDAPGRRRSARIAAQSRGAVSEAAATEPGVSAEMSERVEWAAYGDLEPRRMKKKEVEVFKPLMDIVNTLLECPDPSEQRNSNGYKYYDCPSQKMSSEIIGCNFRVDSVIANSSIYQGSPKEVKLAAAQTAVVMEFKKTTSRKGVYQNRKRLLSAANHIMNDDARRNWMYGITIENTEMSLWYFSRSYSMKSKAFNFTEDFNTFIHVFLSLLYATDEELGHDPTIHRRNDRGRWCYVYEMKSSTGSKYYKALDPLYYPRLDCITGRKSRVWRAVEVHSPENLEPIPNVSKVALKDCWMNGDAPSEMEIQSKIFEKLKGVKQAGDYLKWASSGLRKKLEDALESPHEYLMEVVMDWKEESSMNKEKQQYKRAPLLLAPPDKSDSASHAEPIPSSQMSSSVMQSSSDMFNTCTTMSRIGQNAFREREYKVRQHYRVIYGAVGESINHVTDLPDAIRGFEDTFIALTLLFLAGWVHRDVSAGNIILVRNEHGVRGKLSDLEYADESSRMVSTDPKTGTPFFMPVEIHSGEFLYPKFPSISSSPKYIFIHDLESLWWIMLWILRRVPGSKKLGMTIFDVGSVPHPDRKRFFQASDDFSDLLESCIHEELIRCGVHSYLTTYHYRILHFYATEDRDDVTKYRDVYNSIWNATADFIDHIEGVDLKLGEDNR